MAFKKIFFNLARIAVNLSLLFAAMNLDAAAFHGIEVRKLQELPGKHFHGYRGLAFLVLNRSAESKSVTLTLKCKGLYDTHITRMTKSFSVPAGGMVNASLRQPALALNQPRLDMLVDGFLLCDVPGVHINSNSVKRWDRKPSILVTKTIPGDISKWFDYLQTKTFEVEYDRTDIPTREWGSNWLDFSRYDGIALSEKDFEDLPGSVKQALDSYVKLGGSILCFSSSVRYRSEKPLMDLKGNKFLRINDGFGVRFFTNLNPEKLSDKETDEIFTVWNQSKDSSNTKMDFTLKNAVELFPIMKDVRIPVRTLLAIMIIYSFIIGPLALFMLHRENRRIHILWISPVAAVLFLLIIIFFALFGEGLAHRVRKTSLTLLDEKNHSADTLGLVGLYFPMAPGHLDFSVGTEVRKVFTNRYESQGFAIDWSSGQRLEGGWIRSRIPAVFFLRKSEFKRERLKITRSDGKLEVVNGLGAKIEALRLIDFNGAQYHATHSIAPGAKLTLSRDPGTPVRNPSDSLRGIFLNQWFHDLNLWPANTPSPHSLAAGEYIARLEHSPFIESGLKSQDELVESCVVIGAMAP